jgi:hypothetical protein
VAYAEKRGKCPTPWRVKYKLPNGTDTSEYLIRRFLRPAWGASVLDSLSTEQIAQWENALPATAGVSRRTARDARSLLCTILGDAASTKPSLIPYNPALCPRNRGRRTGRRMERAPQRAWTTPLQALLLAERAALMSGRDEDFTMIIAIGYTGLRWGEVIGLERDYVRPGEIHVEWQLREVGGVFHRLPPKDDSYPQPSLGAVPARRPPAVPGRADRRPAPGSERLSAVRLRRSARRQRPVPVPQPGRRPPQAQQLRAFRPACDGRHEATGSRPARVVMTDATTWPGIPVAAWPPARPGASYAPPAGRVSQPSRTAARQPTADPATPRATVHNLLAPEGREKLTSQIPPRYAEGLTLEVG